MDGFEVGVSDMGVDLRSRDITVPEHCLDASEVSAIH